MKRLTVYFTFLLFALQATAQQDPMFSQYLYNMLTLNPAYAGSRDQLSATLFYRNQWTGFEGAPVTANMSVHSPLRGTNGAWGINVFNDRIGVQKQNFLNFNYAYRVMLQKGSLSMGLSGGFYQFSYDWNSLKLENSGDVAFRGNESKTVFNAGAGIYYQSSRFALGLGVPHIFNKEVLESAGYTVVNPVNHYFLTGSYLLPINEDYKFKPSAMLKLVKNAPAQFDLNATVIYRDALYLGVSYRSYQEASLMAQYQLNSNWWFGYAYDVPFGVVGNVSKGSHEVMIGFEYSFDKSKVLSPRYF